MYAPFALPAPKTKKRTPSRWRVNWTFQGRRKRGCPLSPVIWKSYSRSPIIGHLIAGSDAQPSSWFEFIVFISSGGLRTGRPGQRFASYGAAAPSSGVTGNKNSFSNDAPETPLEGRQAGRRAGRVAGDGGSKVGRAAGWAASSSLETTEFFFFYKAVKM